MFALTSVEEMNRSMFKTVCERFLLSSRQPSEEAKANNEIGKKNRKETGL